MKKTLVFTLVLTLILSVASFVNAATVSAPEAAKKDETVTVTIDFGEVAGAGEFYVKYEPTELELLTTTPTYPGYIEKFANSVAGNTGWVFGSSTGAQTITLEFKVLAENGTATVEFAPVADAFSDAAGNAISVSGSTTTITIGEGTPEESTPESSVPESSTPGSSEEEKKDDNKTDKPTSMPQTGVNVAYVAGAVVLALAAGYVVSKKD